MTAPKLTEAQRYCVQTIVEPFPLFYSHVSYPDERRPETARGPRYAAGSQRREYFTEQAYSFMLWQAEHLRKDGWTVLVTTETDAGRAALKETT